MAFIAKYYEPVLDFFSKNRNKYFDNWLRHIKDVYSTHQTALEAPDDPQRFRRLCELNVRRQVENAVHSSVVQLAWRRGQPVDVHGWIYDLEDGLLKDQGLCVGEPSEVQRIFRS